MLPLVLLVLALVLGVPIAVALAGAGMFGIYVVTGDFGKVMGIISLAPFSTVADYALTTIPTAGFSTKGDSIESFAAATQWTLVAFMILGGFNLRIVKAGHVPSNNSAIGTGPFVLGRFVPGEVLTVTRNANYWGSEGPYLDGVEIIAIAEEAVGAEGVLVDRAQTGLIRGEVSTVWSLVYGFAEAGETVEA